MRDELRRADARHEVLLAAAGWRAEGAIDDTTAAAIAARYPDDRHRARPAFRALFFLFTLLAGLAIWGFGVVFTDIDLFGERGAERHLLLLAVLAALSAAGAARALGRLRLRGFGVEEGLAALAIGFAAGAGAVALDRLDVSGSAFAVAFGLGLAAVALAVAWGWGIPATGAVATAALFGALAALPSPRLLWIGAALPLALGARRLAHARGSPPAHRARANEVRLIALTALYVSLHPALGVARQFAGVRHPAERLAPVAPLPDLLGWIAIVALPAWLLGRGLRSRDRLELDLGAVGLLASAAALLERLDAVPVWAQLLAAGAALGALALVLRRGFARAPGRTLAGFTDRPLGADASGQWLELAATLAALAPEPRRATEPPVEPAGFRGEGGDFGGGGASARF